MLLIIPFYYLLFLHRKYLSKIYLSDTLKIKDKFLYIDIQIKIAKIEICYKSILFNK